MKFEMLKEYTKEEISEILNNNCIEKIKLLPLNVGEYCEDLNFAIEICMICSEYDDEEIKANSILGLSYIARNHTSLNIPKFQEFLSDVYNSVKNSRWKERVLLAVEDINLFLKTNYIV